MALPPTVRVKLSSEAAGSISITPVVVQEMPVRELVEYMLGVTGKDETRLRELLLRGSLVSGASRFRWTGWDASLGDLRELLGTFPDPDPSRRFAAANCTHATLRGGRQPIEISREAGARKGLFQRDSFWNALMKVIDAAPPVYAGYSYRERADRYHREFSQEEAGQLRIASPLVRYTTLGDQIRTVAFTQAELLVKR
ncbi:MAG: hypothetical protein NTW28_36610 [Candidatus Solibacter sp.]|nr:hypothetical protein [Candidatus Solibacter sp.]